jgi:NAD-dependent dihydropyrimidine dehydrogenase PreA subunit
MSPAKSEDEKLYIFYNWCKSCGICVGLCPQDVFELGPDGKPIVAHPENCTLCGICETHCPDFAIGWSHGPEHGNGTNAKIEAKSEPQPEAKPAGDIK